MRTRRPQARGTRYLSGVNSGVSWATIPSGVTFDQYGLTTDSTQIAQAELDFLDGLGAYPVGNATVNKLLVSGVSHWASDDEVLLTTGLSAIESIVGTVICESVATTMPFRVTFGGLTKVVAGSVSAHIEYDPLGAGAATPNVDVAPGCSIAFMAIGT